jgi:hypothetical protein
MALGDPTLHQDLMKRMAEVQGFDLRAEQASGTLSDADAADMLLRCRGCRDVGGCSKALDAGKAPTACNNDSRWDALRAVMRM